jgi:hypothetical protein
LLRHISDKTGAKMVTTDRKSPIWIGGILGVLGVFGLIGYLRHQARRRVRVLLDMPRDQWQDWLVSRTENLGTAGVDPGFSDGEEQDPRPPD